MGIIWTIIIGFVAGVIAKFIMPGDNEPSGFILTTILGIVGAFVATWLGQALGWYRPGEGAGLVGAIVGAIIVLLVWGAVTGRARTERIGCGCIRRLCARGLATLRTTSNPAAKQRDGGDRNQDSEGCGGD